MNKYEEAIRLVDACRTCDPKDQELWDQLISYSYDGSVFAWYAPMAQHPDLKRVIDEATQRLNALFEHLRQTFGSKSSKPYVSKNKSIANKVASPETVEACKQMLKSFEQGEDRAIAAEGIRGNPPSVSDEIYPIALAKLVMGFYRVPEKGYNLPNFNWLHDTYGHIILATYPVKSKNTPEKEAEIREIMDKHRARFALEDEYKKRFKDGDTQAAAEWRQYIADNKI
jgi:hypothetical protein